MKKVEEYLKEMALPFTKTGDNTWIVQPRTNLNTRIAIQVNEPVITFSTVVAQPRNPRRAPYRQLLVWNATFLLHAAYGIVGENIVLSGALEFENLDLNEFRGMIDDISMGIDSHFAIIREWFEGKAA